MYFKEKNYVNDFEILATEKNLVTFSGTIDADSVTAGDDGKKWVLAGSLIDADGKVVTETGTSTYSLSTTPVGILYKTVEVTHGDMPGALIVEGYVRADRVLDAFENTKTAVKEALPNIKFI